MVLETLSVVVEEFEIRLLSIWHAEIAEALKVVGQRVPQGLRQNFQSASHAKLRQPVVATEVHEGSKRIFEHLPDRAGPDRRPHR